MVLSTMKWDIFLLLSITVCVCQIIMFGVSLSLSLTHLKCWKSLAGTEPPDPHSELSLVPQHPSSCSFIFCRSSSLLSSPLQASNLRAQNFNWWSYWFMFLSRLGVCCGLNLEIIDNCRRLKSTKSHSCYVVLWSRTRGSMGVIVLNIPGKDVTWTTIHPKRGRGVNKNEKTANPIIICGWIHWLYAVTLMVHIFIPYLVRIKMPV